MALRRTRIDKRNPQAVGVCDRADHVVLHKELRKEMVYRGNALVWNGLLVCKQHLDKPHPQDRRVLLRPDPVPVLNPRPPRDTVALPDDDTGLPVIITHSASGSVLASSSELVSS